MAAFSFSYACQKRYPVSFQISGKDPGWGWSREHPFFWTRFKNTEGGEVQELYLTLGNFIDFEKICIDYYIIIFQKHRI